MNNSIAVVIPCYNHGVFLDECVESVLASRRLPDNICIVDDGSDDPHTHEVLKSIGLRHPIVHVVRQTNKGLASARNRGIDETRSDYVAFLDADDRMDPGALQSMETCLEDLPESIGWVYPDCREFQNKESFLELPEEVNLYHLIHENGVVYGGLIRRCVLDQGFRFDEDMRQGLEDWEFWLRLSLSGIHARKASGAVLWYRQRGFSMISHTLRVFDKIVEDFRGKNGLHNRERLARIKKRWAPAIALRVPMLGLERQTLQDTAYLSDLEKGPVKAVAGAVLVMSPNALGHAPAHFLEQLLTHHRHHNRHGVTWIASSEGTAGALISYAFWLSWNIGIRSRPHASVFTVDGLPADRWTEEFRSQIPTEAPDYQPLPECPQRLGIKCRYWPVPHAYFAAETEPMWPERESSGPLALISTDTLPEKLSARPHCVVHTEGDGAIDAPELWDLVSLGVNEPASFVVDLCRRIRPCSIHFACDSHLLRILPELRSACAPALIIMELAAMPELLEAGVALKWDSLIDRYIVPGPVAGKTLRAQYVSPTKLLAASETG